MIQMNLQIHGLAPSTDRARGEFIFSIASQDYMIYLFVIATQLRRFQHNKSTETLI